MAGDKWTEIVCIVDQSGSMYSVKDDAIGGFNQFLDEQRKLEGRARLTLTLFNHETDDVCTSMPLEEVESLSAETFRPDGMTALMDAVGQTIERLDAQLGDHAEAPDHVIVLILTDGRENASRQYRREQIAEMIDRREQQRDWEFVFWGANIDATHVAGRLSIDEGNVSQFEATGDGLEDAFGEMSQMTRDFRESNLDGDLNDLRDDSDFGT